MARISTPPEVAASRVEWDGKFYASACQPPDASRRLRMASRMEGGRTETFERYSEMSKILAVLIAAVFATGTAFAAGAAKKDAAPAAEAASGAKADAKADKKAAKKVEKKEEAKK
ncbi:MAG: hypothetical protein AMXMBFR66_29650 [Pseudomonadota bacterium]